MYVVVNGFKNSGKRWVVGEVYDGSDAKEFLAKGLIKEEKGKPAPVVASEKQQSEDLLDKATKVFKKKGKS